MTGNTQLCRTHLQKTHRKVGFASMFRTIPITPGWPKVLLGAVLEVPLQQVEAAMAGLEFQRCFKYASNA